jgi:TctA family transporter
MIVRGFLGGWGMIVSVRVANLFIYFMNLQKYTSHSIFCKIIHNFFSMIVSVMVGGLFEHQNDFK